MVTYIPTVEDASTKHRLPGFSLYADPEALEKWRASTGLRVSAWVLMCLV